MTRAKTSAATCASETPEAALAAIGFLMDMMTKAAWRSGIDRGPWQACLATLVLALDPACKSRRLLDALPAAPEGGAVGLRNAMAHLGYYSESLSLGLQDIETRLLPCLFIPEECADTPQVILSRQGDVLTVYDSARNQIIEIQAHSTGSAARGQTCFFTRYEPQRQTTSRFLRDTVGRGWFAALVGRFSGSFWQILATCLALNIFALAPPVFIMLVYDRVISPYDLSALGVLAAGVLMALLAEWALRDIRSEGLAWMTARLDNLVGSRIFAHLIGLPPALIERASVAAQVARVRTFESVRDFFSSAVFLSFLEIPFVLIALGVMWAIAGTLALVPLCMIAAYAVLFFGMQMKIRRVMRMAARVTSARQQFIIETFERMRSIRINGLGAAWEEKFSTLSGRESLLNFRLSFLGTVAETLAHALTVLAAVLTIGFGVAMIWQGSITTGALVASMILVWRILLPFYSLCTMIPRLEQLRGSIAQVNSLMDIESEADLAVTSASLSSIRGNIVIDNVTLRYEGASVQTLDGLSLDLPPGRMAAVTGRNGSGKSSLLKLVKGLYQPESGAVRIDGYDIRQMDTAELRRQIAYVPQKTDFFPATLRENIVIGNPFATPLDVENALLLADAWQECKDFLDKPVQDIAITPSLAARLSLARAYVQNASIVLIDEMPNSVMNSTAGENLRTYIRQSQGKRTIIAVAHRGDILALADTIIHLRRGAKAAAGSRDDMLRHLKEAA
ncbi:MAG: ATP-binding cassette domain-containing protein [Alphaproteobacteria bacterium]|nr:ATP-binding cassette domain-containing protein [Alphaproteobacteria bacterium]